MKKLTYYNSEALEFKLTVEERFDGMFISTFWDCNDCYEVDRIVKVFETYSGALSDMYKTATLKLVSYTHLKLR